MSNEKIPSGVKIAAYIALLLEAIVPPVLSGLSPKAPLEFVSDGVAGLSTIPASIKIAYACEDCLVPSVHGANVIGTQDGDLLATWFGGSREGGRDVVIWGANYSLALRSWSMPRRIIGPAETKVALGRYIKTVGNSVLVRGEHDELWLYYVTVSVGGWAGSSLNVILSRDEGKTWDAPRRLITSPFFQFQHT